MYICSSCPYLVAVVFLAAYTGKSEIESNLGLHIICKHTLVGVYL